MARELGGLGTSIVAQRAFVWLLTCVRATVHSEVAAVLEYLAAELACVIASILTWDDSWTAAARGK